MAKKMLIDATHSEETRVVVVDGQKVEDFDFESITKRQLAGNIYLAKVTRVEPSLQAAFVEYGGNRHGFLAFSEIHPDYYQIPVADREALLAEEAREEEERRAKEDASDEERSAKSSRGRGRGRKRGSKKSDAPTEAAAVAGLEVVEIDAEDTSTPIGFEVTDAVLPVEDGPLVSVEPVGEAEEIAQAPAPQEEPKDVVAEAVEPHIEDQVPTDVASQEETEQEDTETVVVAEAAVEETAADAVAENQPEAEEAVETEPQAEEDEAPEATGPKSIAESAGLEEEDRVTEEIGDPDSARTVTAEAAEEAVAEAPSPEAAVEVETDTAVQPAPDADVAVEEAATTTEDGAEATDGEAPAEAAKPEETPKKPRRKRRSRNSKKADEQAEAQASASDDDAEESDSSGEAEADVESVGAEDTLEEAAQARTRLRRKYKIQDVVKVRQILLVQVVKEERGNKGAALTTYLSLAGRYCVLMPNTARGGGISRKITNASDRKRLREITGEMEVPKGMGLIVRTAGAERTKAEIKRDYEFLIRQWEQIRETTLESIAPTLIYEEGSLIKRSIRDVYSKEIDQIQVEGEGGYREAKEYMKMLMPSHAKNVQRYDDQIPLFSRYQVESYLNGMFNPTVQLKSGGYIVIGITEALVAIDVNSGRATKQGSIEETALQTNLEAAEEVARQLRLRDLAGLIVIDFIDMDENRNNRAVEKRMKDRLKNDRARIQVGRISAFGLMEMSRQRLRPGMLEATTQPCAHCMGTGLIRSDENMSLSILREVEEEGLRGRSDEITVRAPLDVANYLINNKRKNIVQMEERQGISINILADPSLLSPNFEIDRSKGAPRPGPKEAPAPVSVSDAVEADTDTDGDGGDGKSRRRRGKRGGKRRRGQEGGEGETQQAEAQTDTVTSESTDDEEKPKKRSRNRRRGGRGRKGDQVDGDGVASADAESQDAARDEGAPDPVVAEPDVAVAETEAPEPEAEVEVKEVASAAGAEQAVEPEPEPAMAAAEPAPEEPAKPKKRGWWSFGR